jgi:hypothetical protein
VDDSEVEKAISYQLSGSAVGCWLVDDTVLGLFLPKNGAAFYVLRLPDPSFTLFFREYLTGNRIKSA